MNKGKAVKLAKHPGRKRIEGVDEGSQVLCMQNITLNSKTPVRSLGFLMTV